MAFTCGYLPESSASEGLLVAAASQHRKHKRDTWRHRGWREGGRRRNGVCAGASVLENAGLMQLQQAVDTLALWKQTDRGASAAVGHKPSMHSRSHILKCYNSAVNIAICRIHRTRLRSGTATHPFQQQYIFPVVL